MKDKFTITFTADDWIEIEAALMTKIGGLQRGDYGPEDKPGEDRKWIEHLQYLRAKIQSELYGEARRKKEVRR